MFEQASRLKLRFPYKGVCVVEDLWDLPVKSLDEIFKTLNAELKAQQGESLLSTKNSSESVLELKINIIKHIVKVKQEEKEAANNIAINIAQRQKISEIIASKEDEALKNMSIEDLKKMKEEITIKR